MLESNVELTNHGKERMDERLNIKSLKKEKRMAALAYERGKIVAVENDGTTKILFNDNIFVFSFSKVLITVYRYRKDEPWRSKRHLYEKSFRRDFRNYCWEEEM